MFSVSSADGVVKLRGKGTLAHILLDFEKRPPICYGWFHSLIGLTACQQISRLKITGYRKIKRFTQLVKPAKYCKLWCWSCGKLQASVCQCNFKEKFGTVSKPGYISSENFFKPSKRKDSCGKMLADTCRAVGLEVENTKLVSKRVCNGLTKKKFRDTIRTCAEFDRWLGCLQNSTKAEH